VGIKGYYAVQSHRFRHQSKADRRLPISDFLRETPKLKTTKFGLKKLEISLYRVVQNAFRYIEPFTRGPRVIKKEPALETARSNDQNPQSHIITQET